MVVCLAVIGGGGWRVEPQLGTQECQLVAFQIADRYPAPAIGGADQDGEHQLHGGFFVGEPGDHLGAPALFDEAALGQASLHSLSRVDFSLRCALTAGLLDPGSSHARGATR